LVSLAAELDSDSGGRFPGSDRKDVAALLRWLADGHFVLLGYQRCQVRDGQSSSIRPVAWGCFGCAPTCFRS
jgi:glutamate dehydrogenase